MHSCRFFKQIAMLMLVTLLVSGCATIVSGSKQNVKITSDPSVADVKIEQLLLTTNVVEWEGKTPANIKLLRKGSFLVTVSFPGYQKAEIPISSAGMNGWVWGNLAFGGLIGILIDMSTGAAAALQPGEINVKLVAVKTSQIDHPEKVFAVVSTGTTNGTKVQAAPLTPLNATN